MLLLLDCSQVTILSLLAITAMLLCLGIWEVRGADPESGGRKPFVQITCRRFGYLISLCKAPGSFAKAAIAFLFRFHHAVNNEAYYATAGALHGT